VIVGAGRTIAAGQPLTFTLTGLPHRSPAPRRIALTLALGIVIVGVWAAGRADDPAARTSERKRLLARREKLFQDLVKLEHDFRRGRLDQPRYAPRREEILTSLEHIYGALDSDDTGPEPADRTGLAA
jgi:hypothetical protein